LNPDNDPAGRYIPAEGYSGDFYNDTKLWLKGDYEPGTGWKAQAYDTDWNEVITNFFIIFYKNLALFFISAEDIVLEYPAGRVSDHWIKPSTGLQDYGADVEGGDATKAPIPWGSWAQVLYIDEWSGDWHWVPDGYVLCGYGGCEYDNGGVSWDAPNQIVTCRCRGCTSIPGCDCALLKSDVTWDEWYWEWPLSHHWVYVTGIDQTITLDSDFPYSCACLKKIE
jgi:hypothetical protein